MKNGFVKLGDFGIAKNFQRTIDKAKTMVGTPYYLSPEIIESKPYDSKSDIWSLGVLLYEMMTFKMPFNANSLASLIIKITRGNYIPPPVIYTKDLRELVSKCLTLDPKNRPTIKEILGMPFIKFHIKSFLDEAQYNKEFSKTITKKYKEKEKTNIKPKEAKGINVEVFEPKVISGTSIADINIKKNSNNNSNKKIVDYFKQRNIKKEKEEKEKDKKRQEFKDFLKETKKSKKWGGIDQNQYNESGVMWGKNQENQRPILFKENNLKEEEDQSEVNNLNDLLESYDINKITEEQYDKARFLNNLDNVVNEEKGNNDDMNDIVNQGGENKQENNSDIDEECYSEFIKIELIRIKLEKSLGLKTFKDIYRYISHIVYDKDMKCNEDEIKDKIKDDFGNKGYNGKEIDSILKKFPEIYSLILKEKSIEQ
jgi:serine/threonine protein kinase